MSLGSIIILAQIRLHKVPVLLYQLLSNVSKSHTNLTYGLVRKFDIHVVKNYLHLWKLKIYHHVYEFPSFDNALS